MTHLYFVQIVGTAPNNVGNLVLRRHCESLFNPKWRKNCNNPPKTIAVMQHFFLDAEVKFPDDLVHRLNGSDASREEKISIFHNLRYTRTHPRPSELLPSSKQMKIIHLPAYWRASEQTFFA